MSKKTVMVTLACLMSAGILFCGCGDKKPPAGEKPDPGRARDVTEAPKGGSGAPSVEIVYC